MTDILCWCGAVPGPQDAGDGYAPCPDCGTLVSLAEPVNPVAFYSFNGYWHTHQVMLGYPALEQRARNDWGDRIPQWLAALRQHAPVARTVLEIGAAHGSFVKALQQAGYQPVGVEPDPATVQWAEQHNQVALIAGVWPDVASWLPLLQRFDAVCMFDVLEHFHDPVAALESAHYVLGAQGRVMIQTPWVSDDGVAHAKHRLPVEHRFLFTLRAMARLLDRAGLRVVHEGNGCFDGDMFVVAEKKA